MKTARLTLVVTLSLSLKFYANRADEGMMKMRVGD